MSNFSFKHFASTSGRVDVDGCYLRPCGDQSDGQRWPSLWSSTNQLPFTQPGWSYDTKEEETTEGVKDVLEDGSEGKETKHLLWKNARKREKVGLCWKVGLNLLEQMRCWPTCRFIQYMFLLFMFWIILASWKHPQLETYICQTCSYFPRLRSNSSQN